MSPQPNTVPSNESEAEKQIRRAKELEKDRAAVMEKITDNRNYLRLMDKNDALTDEQGEWLDKFYPSKEKGERRSEDDVKATREAKLEARGKKPATPPATSTSAA